MKAKNLHIVNGVQFAISKEAWRNFRNIRGRNREALKRALMNKGCSDGKIIQFQNEMELTTLRGLCETDPLHFEEITIGE